MTVFKGTEITLITAKEEDSNNKISSNVRDSVSMS